MHIYKEILITPKIASEYLATQEENRNLTGSHITKLRETMERGEWLSNGVPIILDTKGKLIDGQHRLNAIVQFKKAVKMAVVKGVDKQAYKTIDIGKKRYIADLLQRQGEVDCNVLGSVLRLYSCYARKTLAHISHGSTYISPTEGQDLLDRNPGMRESVHYAGTYRQEIQALFTPSIGATFHFIFGLKSKKKRDEYFESLLIGANLGKNNPILELRKLLIDKRVRYSAGDKPLIIAVMIKTWNNKYSDSEQEELTWKRGDKMPTIK